MKKKLAVVLILVVIIVVGLVAVNVYQNKVEERVRDSLAALSGDWHSTVESVDYSFWSSTLTLNNFFISLKFQEGVYDLTTPKLVAEGINFSVLSSEEPGTLADRMIFEDVKVSLPGMVSTAREEVLTNVKGPFGQLRRLVEEKAPERQVLTTLYQVAMDELLVREITYHGNIFFNETNSVRTVDEITGRNVSFLTADNILFKNMKEMEGDKVMMSTESFEAAYDLSSLASIYVPGREKELFRQMLNPKQPVSMNITFTNVHVEPRHNPVESSLEKAWLDYRNTDTEQTISARIDHMVFKRTDTAEDADQAADDIMPIMDLNMVVEGKVNDTEFNPITVDFAITDLFTFKAVGEFQGRMPQTVLLRRLLVNVEDMGLVDAMLKHKIQDSGESMEEARAPFLAAIDEAFITAKNAFMMELGENLKRIVNNSGGQLQIKIEPQQPLSMQNLAIFFLFNPQSLNYTIESAVN